MSSQGYYYYLSILDDFTRFTWIFPLITKSQALQTFIEFQHMIEKCLNRKIKSLQTDWGGEFRPFLFYLTEQGIQFRHPYPYIHHQNEKIERKHRHIVETGFTLHAQTHLPLKFWWNAFHTTTFLINRLPTPILDNKSPFEKLFNKMPDYSVMRVFRCACFPYLRPYNHHKLEFRTARCISLGYSSLHKSYLCLHSSGRIYVSNHVTFDESYFPFKSGVSHSCSSSDHSFQPSSHYSSFVCPFIQLDITKSSFSTAADLSFSQSSPNSSSQSSIQSHSEPSTSHVHHLTLSLQSSTGHPMLTQSNAGILKPKSYITANPTKPTEPAITSKALQDSAW